MLTCMPGAPPFTGSIVERLIFLIVSVMLHFPK